MVKPGTWVGKIFAGPFLFFLLGTSSSSAAPLQTLLLGGGGEPKGDATIFDTDIQDLAKIKDSLSLQLDVSFDGGHSHTESLLTHDLNVKPTGFSASTFNAKIKEYVEKIRGGQIASGERLLVIIDSHGSNQSDLTHRIATDQNPIDDYDQFKPGGSASLDGLLALSDIAREKHVKLAILDLSCHSGNSLPLANANTCVVAASGPDNYSYAEFSDLLYREMKPGDNLEDIFLRARKQLTVPSFPMISTQIGSEVDKSLYAEIGPYLYLTDSSGGITIDQLSRYFNSLFTDNGMCKRETDFQILTAEIGEYQKIANLAEVISPDGSDLLAELQSYKLIQDGFVQELASQGAALLMKKEVITYGPAVKDPSGKRALQQATLTWNDILTSFAATNIGYFQERLAKATSPAEKAERAGVLEKFQKIDVARQNILREHPDLGKSAGIQNELLAKSGLLFEKAKKASELANQLYDSQYRAKKARDHRTEACRDFVF